MLLLFFPAKWTLSSFTAQHPSHHHHLQTLHCQLASSFSLVQDHVLPIAKECQQVVKSPSPDHVSPCPFCNVANYRAITIFVWSMFRDRHTPLFDLHNDQFCKSLSEIITCLSQHAHLQDGGYRVVQIIAYGLVTQVRIAHARCSRYRAMASISQRKPARTVSIPTMSSVHFMR